MFRQKAVPIFCAALMLAAASRVDALTNTSNPRAMGMGGAFTALARGSDAPTWNPANLGLRDRPHLSLVVLEAGVGASMDGLSLETFNDISGKFLTREDKDKILADMADGLMLNFDSEIKVLNLSISTLALSVNVLAGGNLTVPQDIFDFALSGNQLGKSIEFGQTDGEGMILASTGISGALPFDVEPFREFCIGAGAKYYYGAATGLVQNSGGQFLSTLDEGMQGEGFLSTRRATGGKGMGVDLGIAGVLENDVVFSVGVINAIGGTINWETETKADSAYFILNTHYLDEMIDTDEDIVESSDTTYSVGAFTTQLPRVIHAGVAHNGPILKVAFDLEKASIRSMGYDPKIRLSAGVQLRLIPFFPLRAGISIGGVDGQASSLGFGVHILGIRFDLGVRNRGSFVPTSSRGIGAAAGLRFAW